MVLEEVKLDELNKIFDKNSKNVFDFLLQRTVISYPEFLPGQNNTALYLEKKQCEQWVVQSLGLKPVGEGSYPIDGINDKNGYDVSSLALGQTNRIPLIAASWIPILATSIFSVIGLLQINEK